MISTNSIINTDCVKGMQLLPDNCIPFTLTSPPYDSLRAYEGDNFDFEPIAEELFRLTMPGGTVVWVVQEQIIDGSETATSSYQRWFFRELGFRLHNTLVMDRHGARSPQALRYGISLEFAIVLTKGRPRTVNIIRDKPNRSAGSSVRGSERRVDGSLITFRVPGKRIRKFGARGGVWTYGGNGATDRIASHHPAIMHEQMAQDHILSWSRPGDLVFDPMCGSGTTLKMALLNGRRYLGMEICDRYCEVARHRLRLAHKKHVQLLDRFFSTLPEVKCSGAEHLAR